VKGGGERRGGREEKGSQYSGFGSKGAPDLRREGGGEGERGVGQGYVHLCPSRAESIYKYTSI
jgi:hypothetical protein